jgi:hypothetical protein
MVTPSQFRNRPRYKRLSTKRVHRISAGTLENGIHAVFPVTKTWQMGASIPANVAPSALQCQLHDSN